MDIAKTIEFEQKLATYSGEDAVILGQELLSLLKSEPKPKLHFLSKISKLDNAIGGFYGGQLIVVSGKTGQGKTCLCQSFTCAAIEQNLKVLWFSYELDAEDFLRQFKDVYLEKMYLPKKLTGRTLYWIEQRIYESKLKYNTSVAVVDHLHFLCDLASKSRSISFDIGAIVRGLKLLALKHNIVIFLICHTMKVKSDSELGLGDARDSSFIEQEGDTVLYVWRDEKTENRAVVKIAKDRKNGVINKKVRLTFHAGRLYGEESGYE
jgi:replicative DNA helicase